MMHTTRVTLRTLVLAAVSLACTGIRADAGVAVLTQDDIQIVKPAVDENVHVGDVVDLNVPSPGPGFTTISASSSDPSGVEVTPPVSGQIHCKVGGQSTIGAPIGFAVVTVKWTNPTTKEVKTKYFVFDYGGKVDLVWAETARVGDIVWQAKKDESVDTFTYGGDMMESKRVAKPDRQDPAQIMAQNPGTGLLVIRRKDSKKVGLVVLNVVAPAPPAASGSPQKPPAKPGPDDKGGKDD